MLPHQVQFGGLAGGGHDGRGQQGPGGDPPLPGIEPDDLVTPKRAAELLGIPVGTVSSWITRYGIEPLGKAGRWHVYDFREIAAIEARPRQPKIAA